MILNGETICENILKRFLPEKLAKTAFQLFKCIIVGVSNTLVDFIVFNGLLFLTGVDRQGKEVVILMGISFCFAVTNSFIWNKNWTFKNKTKNYKELRRQIFIFFIISLGGLAINLAAGNFVVNNIGPRWGVSIFSNAGIQLETAKLIWANIGKACGVFITVIWNFTGYKLIVFK